MKKAIITCMGALLLGAFTFPAPRAEGDSDFKLVETTKNVSLYERWYTISGTKKARELKAVYTIKASSSKVVEMLKKETEGKKWNSNASKFEIKDATATSWVNYIEYDLPWPMDNQDCVLKHAHSDVNTQSKIISFESTTHADYPESKSVSRIPDIKGKWVLNKSGDETKVEYYITTSPSASMPRVVTDPIVRGNLINTMAAFRDLLQK